MSISKSPVLNPDLASETAKFAETVLFPTPPLPERTTNLFLILFLNFFSLSDISNPYLHIITFNYITKLMFNKYNSQKKTKQIVMSFSVSEITSQDYFWKFYKLKPD